MNLRDEEPPVIVSASASASSLWPPNHKMVSVNLVAQIEDDSGEADWGVVAIECNEACPDADMQLLGNHTVSLRATRSGNGAGRVYTIWLQAVDAAGNLSEPYPVEIAVQHNQRGESR